MPGSTSTARKLASLLFGPSDSDDPANFLDSGELTFTAPDDLEPATIANTTARWIRARLASGTYERLRMVTNRDPVSKAIATFPMLEPRPPVLEGLVLGYTYQIAMAASRRVR